MTKDQLKELISRHKISADQIIREEAEMAVLFDLARNSLGAKVIFYGGTALRLAFGSPRYSEDLDFLAREKIDFHEFKSWIKNLVVKRGNWQIDDLKDKRQTIFAVLLVKDDKLKHKFPLKIEIHKPEKSIKLTEELRIIKSPTSILEPLLLIPGLDSLKQLKMDALMKRRKARDVFDLWYVSQALKENFVLPPNTPAFKEREFKNELRVFLPRNYYSVIDQLYGQINRKNK